MRSFAFVPQLTMRSPRYRGRVAQAFGLLTVICGLSSSQASAAGASFYESIAAGVDNANAQAIAYLQKGIWRTNVADTEMIWQISSANRARIEIEYAKSQVKRGLVDLINPITVTIRNTSGVCTVLTFKHIEYGEGGFFSGNSDLKIKGDANCKDADGVVEAEKHLALANDSSDFFQGRIFAALDASPAIAALSSRGKPPVEKCNNATCSSATPDKGPITQVSIYGKTDSAGNPLAPFALEFKDNAVIPLSVNNFLKLKQGSKVIVTQLKYDLVQERGSATLGQLTALLKGGTLSAGDTTLNFPEGSQIVFQNASLDAANGQLKVSRGSFEGYLASGSVLSINSNPKTPSNVVLDRAAVKLDGIEATFQGKNRTVSAQFGSFDTQIVSAELWFSPSNSVRLGYTNLHFDLGCPAGAPAGCLPINWGPNGTALSGKLTGLASDIKGGQLALNNAGVVQIDGGKILSGELAIDTRKKDNLLLGRIDEFTLEASAQNISLDAANKIRVARVKLTSNDILFVQDDPYPVGHLKVEGGVNGATVDGIGDIVVSNAALDATISRVAGDELRVDTAALNGLIVVRYDSNRRGNVDFKVTDARYYRGQGDGKLSMTARDFKYDLRSPRGSEHPECCGDLGFKSDVDVKEMVVNLAADPIQIDAEIKSAAGKWQIVPKGSIGLGVSASVADQEAVDMKIREKVGSTLICHPHLRTDAKTYRITGTGTFSVGSGGGRLAITNASINEGLSTRVEDNCGTVAQLLCGIVGTIISGNPIGGAAAAIMCGKEVDKYRNMATDEIKNKSVEEVSKFRYESTFGGGS
ncbi:hypothetical protein ACFFWD_35575 [Bradyrhizobium erythrophlei]|uniref:hypothetical protein n=1 Tax=Bradyrhizobium erythrophlei TaxID=1437360 RepID=UPI0035EC62E9